MEVVEQIQKLFEDNKYTWKINGDHHVPTKDQIESTLAKMLETLITTLDSSQIEVGRLMLVRSEGHFDVYCMVGSL